MESVEGIRKVRKVINALIIQLIEFTWINKNNRRELGKNRKQNCKYSNNWIL